MNQNKFNYLVTVGAGFIGSNFTRHLLEKYKDIRVVVLDQLTYASNPENLKDIVEKFLDRYTFVKAEISDISSVDEMMK